MLMILVSLKIVLSEWFGFRVCERGCKNKSFDRHALKSYPRSISRKNSWICSYVFNGIVDAVHSDDGSCYLSEAKRIADG